MGVPPQLVVSRKARYLTCTNILPVGSFIEPRAVKLMELVELFLPFNSLLNGLDPREVLSQLVQQTTLAVSGVPGHIGLHIASNMERTALDFGSRP